MPVPREVIAKASEKNGVCLTKAGLVAGQSYLATPKPGGSILLTPIEDE